MTNYGKINSYDSGKGAGTITPEKGGEALAFVKADLQQSAAEPKTGQRFGYETRQVGGGKPQAINLQQQQGADAPAAKQQS
ncbi:cold-shock protein [Sphingopyxis alaskensis]|uniref:cold-shock protein n=1 Tax=Sphingopyxis alaskensis TaxID=117207 RepID=UPI00391D3A34